MVLMKIPLLSPLYRGSITITWWFVEEFGKLTFWSPVAIMAEMLGVFLNIFHFLNFVYIVAERTRELFIQKIPQIVRVENLRYQLCQLFRQSCFSAPA